MAVVVAIVAVATATAAYSRGGTWELQDRGIGKSRVI
jgi:hypothetical protein